MRIIIGYLIIFKIIHVNECNLSWKIVKYCILSEVYMIKTTPHITVSDVMCKKYEMLVYTLPELLASFC